MSIQFSADSEKEKKRLKEVCPGIELNFSSPTPAECYKSREFFKNVGKTIFSDHNPKHTSTFGKAYIHQESSL
jgi:hypothetical protein